ncbi:MAG TPA: TRAP transporter substrate-binding protein, partial [Deltaproteobacteria bacterium]|nr:TRAP transporter substrate-binding protein [Deltaproteobacteria bacterium]
TGHVYSAHIDVANLNWFNSLPKSEQKLLQQSMIEAAHYERQWNRTNEAGFLAKLKKAGMIVDEHPDIASFKAKALMLKDLPMFQEKRTKELLEKFLEATK